MRLMLMGLLPVAIAVDTLLAVWGGWRPASLAFRFIGGASVIFGTLFLLAAALPRSRKALHRWSTPGSLVSVSVLAALLPVEVFARRDPAHFHTRPPGFRVTCQVAPGAMHGIQGETTLSFNSRGMRGPELEEAGNAYRILCIGGSTTECFYLDDSQAWPQLVMDGAAPGQLWVNSTGISGFGTDRHLAFLRGNPVIDQLDAVVLLVGINDLMAAVSPRPRLAPRWAQLRSITLLSKVLGGRGDSIVVEDHGGQNYIRRRARRLRAQKTDPNPDLSDALDQFERNLRSMATLLQERGVRPIFMTQPVLWAEGLPEEVEERFWFGPIGPGKYLSTECLRRGIDAFNQRLVATCEELGVECVDLRELHGLPELYYDDCHYNPAGSREVARILIEHLRGAGEPFESSGL